MTLYLDNLPRFRASELKALGLLLPGQSCKLRNDDGMEMTANTYDYELELIATKDGRTVRKLIDISWSHCNYGGLRPWIICKSLHCHRRAGVLYYHRGEWLCRQCTGLLYASQCETANWRANGRAWALRIKHGIKPGDTRPGCTIKRPKGKHRRTHQRDIERLERAERKAWSYSAAFAANLKARLMAKV